jgi:hypothetical protein
MTDKELLELAAKAAGMSEKWSGDGIYVREQFCEVPWNPLESDSDALRLAVKLRLTLKLDDSSAALAGIGEHQLGAPTIDGLGPWYRKEWHSDSDPYAATRRAITRAAAEIGKAAP